MNDLTKRLDQYDRKGDRKVAARMAWPELVKAEPRLVDLERDLAEVTDSGESFCANAVWFGHDDGPSYRNALDDLVGWDAENPALQTTAAYDLAYDYLYDLLPDCRNCLCV